MKLFDKEYPIVSEKDQKNNANTLYLYAEKFDEKTYVKFGEAFRQTVWDRYDATGTSVHQRVIKVWSSSVGDKPIHRELQSHSLGWEWAGPKSTNPLNTNEAYIVHSSKEIDDMIKFISSLTNPNVSPDFYRDRGFGQAPFTRRVYQDKVIAQAKSLLKTKQKVLINLSTRAGKSFVSLSIAVDLKAKNILILTPFPAAEDSFSKLGLYNEMCRGYKYIHLSAKTKSDEFCDKNIMFCSYQYFDENKEPIKILKAFSPDLIILDECHNTSDSERTERILKSLKSKKQKLIYMSGTPFNDIYTGRFNKDEVITFDFIDFIKYAKKNPKEISLPELYIKNVCNLEQLNDWLVAADPDIFKKADGFNFKTIFGEEVHTEHFFKWLFKKASNQNKLIVGGGNTKWFFDLTEQKKIIAFFNDKASSETASKVLKRLLSDYKVVNVSCDSPDIPVDEKSVNELFEQNEKAIICTCGKLTTGVTIPALDNVWYFKSGKSSELFIQILFRTMTPFEGKKSATMYCFDSSASLSVMKDYAAIRLDNMSTNVTKQDDTDTYQSVINDVLECINFEYLDEQLHFQKEDVEDYLEKLHKIPYTESVASIITSFNCAAGFDDLGCKSIESKDLKVTEANSEKASTTDFNKSLEAIRRAAKSSGKSSNDAKTIEKVVKQILYALRNLDRTIWLNDDIKNYQDLLNYCPEELKSYKKLYKDILTENKKNINQAISDIRWKSDHDQNEEIWRALSFANSTDFSTPPELIRRMFEKFSDAEGPFLDPCCGRGAILLYLKDEVGISLDDLYGIDIDEDNVKICHKLGFKNVVCGDATDEEALVNVLNKVNSDKMKIIMNPPYDDGSKGNGHIDEKILFKALSLCPDAEIVSLQPCNLVVDPYKMMNANKLMNKLKSYEIIGKDWANRAFDIGLSKDLAIYYFDKESSVFKKLCKSSLIVKILNNTETTLNEICNVDKPYKTYILRKTFGPTTPIFWEYDDFTGNKKQLDYYAAFDTKKEKQNFLNVQNSNLYKYIYKKIRFGRQVRLTCVPVLPTYSHPWTDEQLYKYFDLTEEEIKEIEGAIK